MVYETELAHHGVKGQKWGVRRYQNADGSLTRAGKRRYGKELAYKKSEMTKSEKKRLEKEYGLKDKEDEMRAFERRHYGEFDMDDGGGAETVRAKANANRYMKMNEEYEALVDRIDFEASKNATDKFVKKYGKEGVDALNSYNRSLVLKATAAVMTVPVVMIAGTIAMDKLR